MDFALYFHQRHESDLRLRYEDLQSKSKTTEILCKKNTDSYHMDGSQQMSIFCKTKQESFNSDNGSQLSLGGRCEWQHMTLFKWNLQT